MDKINCQSPAEFFVYFNANRWIKGLRLYAGFVIICLIILSTVRGSTPVVGADVGIVQNANVMAVSSPVALNPIPAWFSMSIDTTYSAALGDVDGDGDLDLAVGNYGPNKIYLNKDGRLQTTATWISADSDHTESVAWGDVDGDGDLDLATGNGNLFLQDSQPIKVYLNEGGQLQTTATWTSADTTPTLSIAWGDVDSDGDFDLAAGRDGADKVYLNEGGRLQTAAAWSSSDNDHTESIVWGDIDGDGDLDLATGNAGPNKVYLNEAGSLKTIAVWNSSDSDDTQSIAWGDVDGDGDLDLAVGNKGFDKIYLNDSGMLQTTAIWSSLDSDDTQSIAWGDVDGDSDLDLATGNDGSDKIYLNVGGMLQTTPVWLSTNDGYSSSIIWGDIDDDSDLELVTGNVDQPNKMYLNESSVLETTATWVFANDDRPASIAWGDMDGDGDLDLATGNYYQPNKVYLNEDGKLQATATWNSADSDQTVDIALGDVDGDGDLDFAAGNDGQPNKVYLNESGKLQATAAWVLADNNSTSSVAWGDVDGDGDLDLATGNRGVWNGSQYIGGEEKIYLNKSGVLETTATWSSADNDYTQSIAWGDVDGDGDLDLATGNTNAQPIKVYVNESGVLQRTAVWKSADNDDTTSIAWGDVDGDGDLDLAIGNNRQPNKVYLNENGMLQTIAMWSSSDSDATSNIAWGDADGDGDLDLAVANFSQANKIYVNEDGVLQNIAGWTSADYDQTGDVAWGDVDVDGDLDLAAGNVYEPNKIYLNLRPTHPMYTSQGGQPLAITLHLNSDPVPTFTGQSTVALAPADFYAVSGIRQSGIIPIRYSLFHPASEPMRTVRAFYSLDGGGHWLPAVATPDTVTTDLATSPYSTKSAQNTHIFKWDVFSSGFFGQSDQVVFRMEALPNLKPVKNGVPGPFQRPFVATQTYPFRVRGTQVRVSNENGQPASNTLVYRLPLTQTLGGLPVGQNNLYFHTSATGYLPGRGELYPGDRLLALTPIQSTQKYTLYHTSATPTETGLNAYTVTQAGVQTLTVSAANPLLLLNLDVSLEWDASNDPVFLAQLRENLLKTSYALYDWTNGQVALGQMNVYQAKERWDIADIRIYASNQMRPVAHRGGIVEDIVVLPLPGATQSITATRGEIRIGPTWNRYGDQGAIGDDWPNVLAHELGHFALFLEDTYLGLDENKKLLVPIVTCTDTAMTDPYDSVSSEFRYEHGRWQEECGRTLAELPEWDLIRLAYPALHAPPPENRGPASMPFAFTQIEMKPVSPGATPLLVDANITLNGAGDELAGGHAYLIQPGLHLIDLGRPLLSSIQARGARDGDELCLFADQHFACNRLSNNMPAQFESQLQPLWRPEILLTPINTTTLRIQVNNPGDANSLTATIYPNGDAPQIVKLAPGVPQIVTLQQPAVEAWVDLLGSSPTQRMITGYTTGSGPGRARSHGGPGRARSHGGSFTSGDGRVTLYPPTTLPAAAAMVLQTVTALPELPPGRMAIGRAYTIRATNALTYFTEGSLLFQYIGMEVLLSGQPEENLAVYYWDWQRKPSDTPCQDNFGWQRLPTVLDQEQNFASALLVGPGVYALMSGIEIPLYGPGWNLVSYPLKETRPITQALASIDRCFTTVYGYEATDLDDPWKVYDPDVPDWVNDLRTMQPGHGYWISATQTITWFIDNVPVTPSSLAGLLPTPPATYYGVLLPAVDETSTGNDEITATINGKLCGKGQTREVAGQVVYVVDVLADGPGNTAGCGAPGQIVTITVASQVIVTAPWHNGRPQRLADNGLRRIYLPLITR